MKHMMVDLETMGTRPYSVICSIGAYIFDPDTDNAGALVSPALIWDQTHMFYRVIDMESAEKIGLRLRAGTVKWWLDRDRDAQQAIITKNCVGIVQALQDLGGFYRDSGAQRVWSHGASFDLPLLADAYECADLRVPWSFRDIRDTRTLYELAGLPQNFHQPATGAHVAIMDAWQQSVAACMAFAALRQKAVAPNIAAT